MLDIPQFPSGILVRLDWGKCTPQSLSIIETGSWDLKVGLVGFKGGLGRTDLFELDQFCFEARGEQIHDAT